MELASENYGCKHYRRCKIRAPSCNEIFDCRHCPNEAKVICSLCGEEQDVQQNCIKCGVCMGKYFCALCKFFDDDVSKKHYHCHDCGICRIGGEENFFHCASCCCCYPTIMKGTHRCLEKPMHHNCPVCCEQCCCMGRGRGEAGL